MQTKFSFGQTHWPFNNAAVLFVFSSSLPHCFFVLFFYSDGNLILVDAGCEYFGYVSDVTRTWPVNGTFTLPQRELYEAVLRVKNTCIEVWIILYYTSLQKSGLYIMYFKLCKLLFELQLELINRLIELENQFKFKTIILNFNIGSNF